MSTTAFSFYLFPFISLPKPTGEHQMGVVYRTVDSRIDAAINMDGLQYGSFIDDTTKVPILMLENQWSPYNLSIHSPFFKRSLKRVDCLKFLDTKHFNFTDECLISPLMKNFGYLGEADRKGILDIRNKVVPDFFITTFGYSQFNSKNYEEEGKIIALNK